MPINNRRINMIAIHPSILEKDGINEFAVLPYKIRIFGAGYWRKGKKTYEEKNKLQK